MSSYNKIAGENHQKPYLCALGRQSVHQRNKVVRALLVLSRRAWQPACHDQKFKMKVLTQLPPGRLEEHRLLCERLLS